MKILPRKARSRSGKPDRGLEDWQGSNDRHINRRRLLRRRFTCGPAASHGLCNRYDRIALFRESTRKP
jgi:hypothetical protein